MELGRVLKNVKIRKYSGPKKAEILRVVDDSRKVSAGDLFIAMKGYSVDASEFIGHAISSGAKAVVSEKDFMCPPDVAKIIVTSTRCAVSAIADNFYGHPSGKLKVVGVTGTNGKTTITYLLESIIEAYGRHAGVIGTISHRIMGNATPAANTTPGALSLQGMLAEIVRLKAGYAVMEVSSHSLDQGRVDNVMFDIGIFTNLTSDHLDYHKTRAKYFAAKKLLFGKLKRGGCAVINNDDKKVAALKRTLKCRVTSYGIAGNADVAAADISLSMDGSSFNVKTPDGGFGVRSGLVGMHNVSNILAAVAAAIELEIPAKYIIKGIASMKRVPGRLEAVEHGQSFKIFVDFAHTEDALVNVLRLLKDVAKGRIFTVFGCGGDRDKTKRPLMGRAACEYSDHVIVTSDNPRFEEPEHIISQIESGIKRLFSNYELITDREKAIEKALVSARKDDIILIAGKGHEGFQIIKDRRIPFDDREKALSILERLCG